MNEWISVKERLPESAGSYLVATKNGGVIMTHFYPGRSGSPGRFSSTRINALVTHWMERPAPPEIYQPFRTNADRIRAMNDDELSSFLCKFRTENSGLISACDGCAAMDYCNAGHTGMIDWLHRPEEDEHDD